MLKLKQTLLLFVLILFHVSVGIADDGMWMPHQMKDLGLKAKGLEMDPGNLYKADGTGLMSAVVRVPGGTAGFVSSKGLMLTNHHVAFRAIQRASDKEHDYIRNGFLAKTKAEEIPAGGYTADVLLGYEDVTATVEKELKPGMNPGQREKTIDRIQKILVANGEKKGKDLRCNFKTMYSGNKYYLFTFKRLLDVRIVYAPPESIGSYGGDIDNWMWPRHTCDFTFLRAYVSKDNVGVPYSKDNVPYRPKSVFKISMEGLKEGDFTFIMGYPGRTFLNYTISEYRASIEDMKEDINTAKKAIDFFERAWENNRALQIKYASRVKSLNNGLKNRVGKLEGLRKSDVENRKKDREKAFVQWVNMNRHPERKKAYSGILEKIDAFMTANESFYKKERQLSALVSGRTGPAMLSEAYKVYRTSVESGKPDIERETGYQERNLPALRIEIRMAERGYEFETDKAYFKFMLKELMNRDKSLYPEALAPVLEKGEAGIEAYVDKLYAATILRNPGKRLELLKMKPAALLKLNAPFIKLAAALEKELKVIREKKNSVEQERADLKKVYMAGMLEMKDGKIATDANSSMRFSFGHVKPYSPRDGVIYTPFTTLTGLMEKETGKEPFVVPFKLKALYHARDFGRYEDKKMKDIVTCFLDTSISTGGNSGSPLLNARGEMAGIHFDRTYETVISDYYIIPKLRRSIKVDIRYVLFITDKFSGAGYLLKEMGL